MAHTIPVFQGIKRFIKYLKNNPYKLIFYPYNSYDGSYVIRLTCIGNQVEYHTTQNCLEFCQDSDHAIIINIRRSVSVIINILRGAAVFWKVQIQPDMASDSTDG